jgi:hypothetical protein
MQRVSIGNGAVSGLKKEVFKLFLLRYSLWELLSAGNEKYRKNSF